MRIHSITIENFRGIQGLELRDLPDTGVIVIHGNNEAGKSTILDALTTVLNERHTAGGKKIGVLTPIGRDVSPAVKLEATVGDYSFTIAKQWGKGKYSELNITRPQLRQYTGREADDELARILAENLDQELASTLFLRQGQFAAGISAAGIPSVVRTLDGDAGLSAEEAAYDDTALMQRISDEYAAYFTPTGRPRGDYDKLQKAVENARQQHEELVTQKRKFDDEVVEVERLQQQMQQIQDELPQAQQNLQAQQVAAKHAEEVVAQRQAAQEAVKYAELTAQRAAQDVENRKKLEQRLAQLREQHVALEKKRALAQQANDEEAVTIASLTDALKRRQTELAKARENARRTRAMREYALCQQELSELQAVLDQIEAAQTEYQKLVSESPVRPITDADVTRAEEAASEVKIQRTIRAAATAKLTVRAEDATFVHDDAPTHVDGERTIELFDATTLQFGEFHLTYRAGANSVGEHGAVEAAERALEEVLAELGCEDVPEVRAKRDERRAFAQGVEDAKRRREDILAGRDLSALQERHVRLQKLRAEHAATLGDNPTVLEREAAEQEFEAAEAALQTAQHDAEVAAATLEPHQDRKAQQALLVLETKLSTHEEAVQNAKEELRGDQEHATFEELDAAQQAAAESLSAARATLDEVTAAAQDANVDMAQALLESAQTRLVNLQDRYTAADKRIAELKSYFEMASGIAEKVDRAEATLDAAESEYHRTKRRAEATKLLYDTLQRYREEANARYAAPFAAALDGYAGALFGRDVEFELDDQLQITRRNVAGVSLPIEELSGGAQEQLALLTRFAIAELVARDGTAPVPVVIDDALGATDPHRLQLMNALFNRVGKHAQVIVLTCYPNRYDGVSSDNRYEIEQLKTN
ncbi:AAA family ATPase [Corynebacterium pseudogenitalium]|uniref:AAA family ATPase n=1 Tax=Corynebacterium pseudogenitalium TaxID=38303 RepID=A0ABD4TPT0_9CORY|nr:AAA family ATPase [Corynebacterium pseudogenitalium]MCQ4613778.1 AAA family ATPase [Corynebacterium pseudogenitalium]